MIAALLSVVQAAAYSFDGAGSPGGDIWPQKMAGSTTGLFAAPNGSYAPWLESLRTWRQQTRAAIGLAPGEHGEVFDVASLRWTQTSYVQPQVHTFDLMLWNETSARYTVDRYLDDAIARYGGMDSVLLWPTYQTSASTTEISLT